MAVPVRQVPGGKLPDLTAPNLAPPGGDAPTFFGAYYEWMTTPPPTWEDVAWMREQWAQISGTPFMLKGVCRVDDALRAVDAGVAAHLGVQPRRQQPRRHPGRDPDGPADRRRRRRPDRGLMDGGVRRGSDVVKALALGARAVMIGRAYLWGLAANGQAGVENVLDILRGGIDSALLGLGVSSIARPRPEHLLVPDGFHRALGVPAPTSAGVDR